MNPEDIEKMIRDAEDWANQEVEKSGDGKFILPESRKKMKRDSILISIAIVFIESMTMVIIAMAIIAPFPTFPRTVMFVFATLALAIFAITMMLGLKARIRLLFRIESNTQIIALSKQRIAEALENLRID